MVIGLILLAYPVYAHAMRACDNPCARLWKAHALLRTGLCADSQAMAIAPCRRLQSAPAGRLGWNQLAWVSSANLASTSRLNSALLRSHAASHAASPAAARAASPAASPAAAPAAARAAAPAASHAASPAAAPAAARAAAP